MMKLSKPVLFIDFDGTLCFDKYWRSLPPGQYEQMQNLVFGKENGLVTDWMRGRYTAEQVNQLLAEKVGMSFEELWKLFIHDCETMSVSSQILRKISLLRDRYVVILVTGNMDSFSRFTVPALHLGTFFDHISNSFSVGKLKDDEGGIIFADFAAHFQTPIQECILIDNSEKTCSVFGKLGGTAHVVTKEKTLDYWLQYL